MIMSLHQANGTILRSALVANGLFSLLCAAACATNAKGIADALFTSDTVWFGLPAGASLATLAITLGAFAAIVLIVATRKQIPTTAVMVIVALDMGWVALSVPALLFGTDLLTVGGRWVIGLVAMAVLIFGLAQAVGLAVLYQGPSAFHSTRNGEVRQVKLTRSVAVPAPVAWAVMVDHEAYAEVAENLTGVEVLEGDGPGMTRKCYGTRGESWTETAHIWEEGKRYGFTIDTDAPDYPYPLERLAAIWSVEDRGPGHADVAIAFEVFPRQTLNGAIFVRVSMLMFPKLLDRLLGRWVARMEAGHEPLQ